MDYLKLYDDLNRAGIEALVADGQEETLHLDFKTINDAGLTGRDDRRNLACAISGFGNSSGGLIVWGVVARKNADGIDCAGAVQDIQQVRKLVSRLNQLTGEATEPVVAGVVHRAILTANGAGFALSLIPESDAGPHMAKLGENRYYKRSGDSFYMMEHFDVSDMFGRRRKPRLVLAITARGIYPDTELMLTLRNEGRATAIAPYLAVTVAHPLHPSRYGADDNGNTGLQPLNRAFDSGYAAAFGASPNTVLHPGMAINVTKLSRPIQANPPVPPAVVEVRYALACDGQPLTEHVENVSLRTV